MLRVQGNYIYVLVRLCGRLCKVSSMFSLSFASLDNMRLSEMDMANGGGKG